MNLDKIIPKDGPSINEVNKYIEKYSNEIIVIKYGGNVFIDRNIFKNFITDICILNKLGLSIVVVHGGGPRIKRELEKSNIKSNFIRGLRVTDKNIINIVEKVLIEFNREIVNALKDQSCETRRITSKEYNIITVKPESDKLGFVGSPTHIKTNVLKEIIKVNEVPVVAPLGLDENNLTFNINADTAAGAITKKLKARRLIIMSDIEGVLDNDNKLISEINTDKVNELIKNETIFGGMIPKIKNCLDVANNGVKGVVIIDGRKSHSILFELLSDKGAGTLIRK